MLNLLLPIIVYLQQQLGIKLLLLLLLKMAQSYFRCRCFGFSPPNFDIFVNDVVNNNVASIKQKHFQK